MAEKPSIRGFTSEDALTISKAFTAIGWHKPVTIYEGYLVEQERGEREVFLAFETGCFAGYITVVWRSSYPPFRDRGVPEIKDLNVLPEFRRRGIGSALLDAAERLIRTRSAVAGIGVGVYTDYGAAQRLYVGRGYIPDGRGLYDGERWIEAGATVRIDDEVTLQLEKRLDS